MTLKDVADPLGFTPSHISQIERGLSNPSVSSLLGIAGVLGLPMEHFFLSEEEALVTVSQVPSEECGPILLASAANGSLEKARPVRDTFPERRLGSGEMNPVVRCDSRQVIQVVGGVEWQKLTPPFEQTIEFIELRYEVGASSGDLAYSHQGREYGVVLQGRLKIEHGFSSMILGVGDSISFDSTVPHRLENVGDELVRGIWVVSDRY